MSGNSERVDVKRTMQCCRNCQHWAYRKSYGYGTTMTESGTCLYINSTTGGSWGIACDAYKVRDGE